MDKKTSNEYEHEYWPQGKYLCGIDEAGRGPIAGPLVVAGVIFPLGYQNDSIYDSKALREKKREELFDIIINDALEYKILIIDEREIERKNIYQATRDAMQKIAEELNADVVLTDAMKLPDYEKTMVIDIVKGDQKSISIAAASILAKVTRDRIMIDYDLQYPLYGFAAHKGYPTKQHLEALEKYGVLDIHRRNYGPVNALLQPKLDL